MKIFGFIYYHSTNDDTCYAIMAETEEEAKSKLKQTYPDIAMEKVHLDRDQDKDVPDIVYFHRSFD